MVQVMPPSPPESPIEVVSETFHGVTVDDPYRWLEQQNAARTRTWIEQQTWYARTYLDRIPGRDGIRQRVRELLAIETYDSLKRVGDRYFFRKRLPDQEQPCIYMREGPEGCDELLVDPLERGQGNFLAVKPLHVSPNGRLLLYEVKNGGERTGTFEILDVERRKQLPDSLPRGYIRGFAFASDGLSFYYVHEAAEAADNSPSRAAYQHIIGTLRSQDTEIFSAPSDDRSRLVLFADGTHLVFGVYRLGDKVLVDLYVRELDSECPPKLIFNQIDYMLGLRWTSERLLAITDRDAPNRKIVEIRLRDSDNQWIDIVPESDAVIRNWSVVGNYLAVSYMERAVSRVCFFDLSGTKTGELPIRKDETVRIIGGGPDKDELLFETESFTRPVQIFRHSIKNASRTLFAECKIPFESLKYNYRRFWYTSKDHTPIPIFLVGKRELLDRSNNPIIMTSYGGFSTPMTPQFSIFVAFLMERGCLFALPNIRGGSEFGIEWHKAAQGRHRQTAYDDFLSAAEWLISSGRTSAEKLAIFGGSNSGLLVSAALTQRPDLFRAVVCMVPLTDMLRYHLFDQAKLWIREFGTPDDPEDFQALLAYSPYHNVKEATAYPAAMFVSGDADGNCNSLHARKMTARLQAANTSSRPIFLHYSTHRGHSPVLPLSERVEALTDRMLFLCDQLQLSTSEMNREAYAIS